MDFRRLSLQKGVRFLKELEAGKQTVQLNKVSQVLRLFGEELQPAKIKHDINEKG